MKECQYRYQHDEEKRYLFSIDPKFEEELNNGILSEEPKKKFEKNGFSLPDNVAVKKEEEKEWTITDEKKFIIIKEEGKLNIYEKSKCQYDALPNSKYCKWHAEEEGIYLQSENLTEVNFQEAYLVKANLKHSNIEHSKLIYANLQGAKLSYARLQGADLRHCNLKDADLFHARINGAEFLMSATLDDIDINEREGNRHIKEKRYLDAIDSYSRAIDVYTDLKNYFRVKGFHDKSGKYYIKEWKVRGTKRRIGGKILKIKDKKKREDKFHWFFPDHEFKESKFFHFSFLIECKMNWLVNRFLYHTSRYGESVTRVVLTSSVIMFIYSAIYWLFGRVNEVMSNPMSIFESLSFSIGVFLRFGIGNFHLNPSLNPSLQIITMSEALLGTFMIAFFVVVISRKIIR